jgi:PAS domain S-box-containing protein
MSDHAERSAAVARAQVLARDVDLRRRAISRLDGRAVTAGRPTLATDALSVLHALASEPDTAADALALLHELQVHQVELDLQAEELQESRTELEGELFRLAQIYEGLPVACFTIDADLVIWELNRGAAELLGVAIEDACGLPLDPFLAIGSAARLRERVASVLDGRPRSAASLHVLTKGSVPCEVLAHVGPDPAGERLLLVLTDVLTDGGETVVRRRVGH